jgi:hypothetical protein
MCGKGPEDIHRVTQYRTWPSSIWTSIKISKSSTRVCIYVLINLSCFIIAYLSCVLTFRV